MKQIIHTSYPPISFAIPIKRRSAAEPQVDICLNTLDEIHNLTDNLAYQFTVRGWKSKICLFIQFLTILGSNFDSAIYYWLSFCCTYWLSFCCTYWLSFCCTYWLSFWLSFWLSLWLSFWLSLLFHFWLSFGLVLDFAFDSIYTQHLAQFLLLRFWLSNKFIFWFKYWISFSPVSSLDVKSDFDSACCSALSWHSF